MLTRAILYEEQLKKKYIEATSDDYFKFYFSSAHRSFNLDVCNNDYWTIQMVSVDKNNNIIGFMSVSIDDDSKVVNNFGLINFTKKPNIIFSSDVMKFLRMLRDNYNASKFEFNAFVDEAKKAVTKDIPTTYHGVQKKQNSSMDTYYVSSWLFSSIQKCEEVEKGRTVGKIVVAIN